MKILEFIFKIKVTIYLKGGNSMRFYCTNFNGTRLGGSKSREFTWEGLQNLSISFDPDEIQAIKCNRVFKLTKLFR